MTWQAWVLVWYFIVNALGSVALIGRHRAPITPGAAVALVVIYAGLIWCVVGAVS